MSKYFMLDKSPLVEDGYILRLKDHSQYFKNIKGSYGVFYCRLLNITYPNYLRYCRDHLGAKLVGKHSTYITVYFKNNQETRDFLFYLDSRVEDVIKQRGENGRE